MVRDHSKDDDAHHHDDQKKARPTSGMKGTETLDPIGHQHLTGLEGEDRLMLRSMILEDAPNLFEKGDGPQIGQEDDQSNDSVHQIEQNSTCSNHGNGESQPLRHEEGNQKEEEDAETEGESKGKAHGPGADLLLFFERLI